MTFDYPNLWEGEPDLNRLRRARAMLKVDERKALEEFEELANQGSLMSMLYLGWQYIGPSETGNNLDQAEIWFRRATNGGSILGSFYLGTLYRNSGRYSDALETYNIGADKRYPPLT
jgi:TPR repeat protein